MTQLGGGGLPVVHTVELLDWMAGGPVPAVLASRGAAGGERASGPADADHASGPAGAA